MRGLGMEKVRLKLEKSSIVIKKSTKERLAKLGSLTSTWDVLLNNLLDHLEHCDRFWEDRY